jgi:Tfp pilus assembly protein PilF
MKENSLSDEILVRPDQAVAVAMQNFANGKTDIAEQILRNVLEVDPENAVAMHRLGTVLASRREFYEALYRLDESIRRFKKNPLAHSNRGMVLAELGHHDRAMIDFELALKWAPNDAVIWNNKGNVLVKMNRCEEAVSALRRCLSIDSEHQLSWYNLGVALHRAGRHDEAIKCLQKALELKSDDHEARFNLSIAELTVGDYTSGWKNYEARWLTNDYAGYHAAFPEPTWHGEDLTGKSILVFGDQGFGDSIMFSRYLPMIVATGAKVYCNPHTKIHDLFAKTFPDITWLVPGGEQPKTFDYKMALPSAPLAFGTTLETIPAPVPFAVSPLRIDGDGFLNVGVCWSGNWKHVNDSFRSIPLRIFQRIFGCVGVYFFNLQYEVRHEDRKEFEDTNLQDLGLKSWSDTAAAVAGLDLVVTVDTSVAHMAATMGIPTWILLPEPRTDWRWLKERTDCLWYPSVTLYRQSTLGDWNAVINRVRRDIDRFGSAQNIAA